MKLFKKKAQSTAEYAIIIALVIGAAVAMQTYVKRGLQGGVKFATDKLKGSDPDIGITSQYEPYYLKSETDTTRTNVYSSEEFKSGGEVARAVGKEEGEGEKTSRASKQVMRGVDQKD